MITFSSLGKVGGLGNQLFQVSCTISLALKKNVPYALPNWIGNYIFQKPFKKLGKFRREYLFNLQRALGKRWVKRFFSTNRIYREKGLKYHSLENLPVNIDLVGYFQSEKYFNKHQNQIRKLFTLNKNCQCFIDDLYNKYAKGYKNVTAVHIRRSDYLKKQDLYPFCGINYYNKAMKYFKNSSLFMVYSDDIEWCKQNILESNVIYIDTSSINNPISYLSKYDNSWIDLFLMSKANNNIIANSSFSWWGSWLNENPDKIVIAPEIWFGDEFKKIGVFQDDIFIQDWIIIPK